MSTEEDRKRQAHRALVARILQGDGRAAPEPRRAAFDNAGLDGPLGALIDDVARRPARITDEDVAAVKATGLAEDEIFELVVCAAVGQATRQYEAALDALARAVNGEETTGHAPRDPR